MTDTTSTRTGTHEWTQETRDDVHKLVKSVRRTTHKLADDVLDLLATRVDEQPAGNDPETQRAVIASLLRVVADDPELRVGHAGISPKKLRAFADAYERGEA